MEKEEIFSKLNIKDYNRELENILEKKSFSEDAKNLLITMLYKVETSYSDYAKVKINCFSKKQLIEEIINIIDKECNEIEIVKPSINEETILKDKTYLVDEDKKKIYVYPNANILLFALYVLSKKKFVVKKNYEILKKPIENMLNSGWQISKSEIIRDFDGWHWAISVEDIESISYNLIYQNIYILLGNDFIEEQLNTKQDLIKNIENELILKYGEEIGEKIYTAIYRACILEYLKQNKNEIDDIFNKKDSMQEELKNISNKKQYLGDLADNKKVIGKEIRRIDTLLNDNNLLKKEFINENSKLDENRKVFSISNFVENLQSERTKLMKELDIYSELMKPVNYVKTKSELEYKINLLNGIDKEKLDIEEESKKAQIDLQKIFLQSQMRDIKKASNKKEFLDLIYRIRYYKLLPIFNVQIKDVKDLDIEIRKVEEFIITKACNLKAMRIICNVAFENYKITSKILENKIIELEKLSILLNRENNKLLITIHDDNVVDNVIEYEDLDDLNIKLNKKIKIFL